MARVALVTGGTRGIGAAIARALLAEGYKVAVNYLGNEAVASKFRKETGIPVFLWSVADFESCAAGIEKVVAELGPIDVLVNNAGITRDALTVKYKDGELVKKMPLADWQLVIDVNLTGAFLCGREAAIRMIELGCKGCIINISSISRAGNMGQINYSATKAGVAAMAVVWAKEFARYGLRAAAIAPGYIGTEMVMAIKPEIREKLKATIPLNRIGEPDEIAATVQFILENDFVNGRCFEVDGGMRV